MSELITRTARLVPYAKRPKQVPSFVTAYSYEPMPDEATADLGSLFVVIEVLVGGRSSEEVADLIIEAIGNQYYNGQHSPETTPLDRFEKAVKTVNQELAQYVNQGNAAWIGKLSAVVAVQAGDELHLSQTGSAEAFLYRGKAAARITGQGPARPSIPSKTFGSIASGALEPNDHILMATPALIHQVALTKLKAVVSETSPNQAIAEITDLLKGAVSERIAALVIEVTTPELAALQIRSEAPAEIQLGTPENVVEAAKVIATPIAQATVTSGKRAGQVARYGWEQARPHVRRLGLSVVGALRQFLTGSGARRRLLITGLSLAIILSAFWWWQQSNGRTQQLLTRYHHDYHQYQLADQAATNGDKLGARRLLAELQAELAALAQAPGRPSLDAKLLHTQLPSGAPTSVKHFSTMVDTKLDQLEHLKHVSVTTVSNFTALKNSQPTHLEYYANRAYVWDEHNDNALYIVNITTSDIKKSAAATAKLGGIKATTISAAGDGLYILTTKPAVWFYRFDTDSLTEQSVGLGQWPAATDIASYGSTLYLLSNSAVYKHLRTASGFSPKTAYIAASSTNDLEHATALAIDGSIYTLSPTGLRQYLAGSLKATAETPSSLADATSLQSAANGSLLLATSTKSRRLGLWVNDQTLTFSQQYQLDNVKALYDASYDSKSKTIYALVDNRLVKFTLR